MPAELTLRYFDCRGRAQFLRNYLTLRRIDFDDDRVPLSADFSGWAAVRDNREISGPLQRLPVLHYDGRTIPEALVIATFLHRQLGDAASLNDEEELRHQILLSSLYTDLMMTVGILIWSDLMYPGSDHAASARQSLERMNRYLSSLDLTLDEWQWLDAGESRPVLVADCMLWEQLDQARFALGEHFDLGNSPTLARFYDEFPGRAEIERVLAAHPCQITGRPGEAEALTALRARLS